MQVNMHSTEYILQCTSREYTAESKVRSTQCDVFRIPTLVAVKPPIGFADVMRIETCILPGQRSEVHTAVCP